MFHELQEESHGSSDGPEPYYVEKPKDESPRKLQQVVVTVSQAQKTFRSI